MCTWHRGLLLDTSLWKCPLNRVNSIHRCFHWALWMLLDLNLFAGAGGLALGLEEAGFGPFTLFEIDRRACATLRMAVEGTERTLGKSVHEEDVRRVDFTWYAGRVRLFAAGAACQPFSLAGKHLAEQDGRNLFPEVFKEIRTVRPDTVLLENVRGITRKARSRTMDTPSKCRCSWRYTRPTKASPA